MDQQRAELAGKLRALSMWASLAEEQAAAAERAVAEGGYPFDNSEERYGKEWFFVDGETMAEGQITWVLRDLISTLRDRGIDLRFEVISHPPPGADEGDYIIAVNDRKCVVWSQDEWAARRGWQTAVIRPLAVINDILAEAGISERLFVLYPGTDAVAWLLDPRIVEAVVDSDLVEASDVPALAVRD